MKKNDFVFFNRGFHGDKYLLFFIDKLLKNTEYFIETGTNVGSTIAFVAKNYPDVRCFSCEPYQLAYEEAKKNTEMYNNINIFNIDSDDFFKLIKNEYNFTFEKKTFFWLDSHGRGYEWPLRREIDFITKNFINALIFIDDFKVPGLECFGYDKYEDQECSFDFIRDHIDYNKYFLYYPNYTEKTSLHHPLRGWALITNSCEDYSDMNFVTKSIIKGRK